MTAAIQNDKRSIIIYQMMCNAISENRFSNPAI